MVSPSLLLFLLISYGPLAIIALIGLLLVLTVPIRSRGLVASAMSLLLVSVLVNVAWQLAGVPLLLSNGFSADSITLGFTLIGLVSAALQVTCWALVLFALFRRPRPTAPAGGTRPGPAAPFTRPEWRP